MLLASLTYVSFALGTLYISSIAGGGISAKPHVFPKCGAWCCLAVALLPHPALGFMQSPKLVPGQNCRGPRSSTVRGLHLCVPFWWLCVPLWLGIYAAWTGKQLLVYVSPHQWEWSIPCLPPQCHHSAAHRTGPVQSMRAAGSSNPTNLVWFWCTGRCGVSCFDFISVTAFYVAHPFLLFFCVACHLLFEKLYFSHLERLVILCTSLVYVYELQ